MSPYLRTVVHAFLALAASLAGAQEPETYRKLLRHCEGLNNTFQCARAIEKSQMKGDFQSYFIRTNGVLRIKTSAKAVELRDQGGDDDSNNYRYSYLTFLPDEQLHVLHLQFYEGNIFSVVHHKSGAKVAIDGFPILSPDSRRFVAISSSGISGYYPNSVEIWRVHNGKMWPEYRYEPAVQRWSPTKAMWADSNTLSFEGECGEELGGAKNCPTATAKFRNGAWRIAWSLKDRQ